MVKRMYLFVYGTLKSQFENDMAIFLRQHATMVGEAKVWGKLYLLGWYPGLVIDKDGYEVSGELYRIDGDEEALLKKLDEYEGVEEGDYRRLRRKIALKDGVVDAWIYETLLESDVEIKSGDFLKVSN